MQHHSDRICGGTSLIFLVCCILQVFLYCSDLKMPLTSSLLSKHSPYAFVLSKCLSESIFQLTLCRKGTQCLWESSCCEPFCSCYSCSCYLDSPWRQPGVFQCVGWGLADSFNAGVPYHNSVCIGLIEILLLICHSFKELVGGTGPLLFFLIGKSSAFLHFFLQKHQCFPHLSLFAFCSFAGLRYRGTN